MFYIQNFKGPSSMALFVASVTSEERKSILQKLTVRLFSEGPSYVPGSRCFLCWLPCHHNTGHCSPTLETMSSTLKAGLKQLMNERDSLEAEISERSARLDAAGVGLAGKLVDKEVLSPVFHCSCAMSKWASP